MGKHCSSESRQLDKIFLYVVDKMGGGCYEDRFRVGVQALLMNCILILQYKT
jgi:hypothetical protein